MFRVVFLVCVFAGIGLGVLSCTFFLWAWWIGAPPSLVLWLVILAYLGLAVVLNRSFKAVMPQSNGSRYGILFSLLCVYVGWLALSQYWAHWHGDWDALAIWNLHARLLYRSGGQWLQTFSRHIYDGHQDYPLLLPSLVASGWTLHGAESTAIPGILSFVFTFLVVALLTSSVGLLSGPVQGFAAGLILLGTPTFILQGMNQMANIPLGFFILLTVVLLRLSERSPQNKGVLVLAGVSAGFACWTKNEGLLFLVCLFASVLCRGRDRKQSCGLPDARMLGCGVLPVLAIVLSFKFILSPPNDLFTGTHDLVGRWMDSSRYAEISAYFYQGIVAFGAGRISPFIAAADYIICFGRRRSKSGNAAELWMPLLLTLMLAGYFMIYVGSPHDLQWHLSTSFSRLLLHLWPTFLFWIACATENNSTSLAE